MHKITTHPSGDGHRSECSEGDFISNEYPTEERAKEKGLNHKAQKDGDPSEGQRVYPHDGF